MAGLHYGFRALLPYKSGVQVSAALWTGLWSVPGWLRWESVTVCSATIRTLTCLLRWGSSSNSFPFCVTKSLSAPCLVPICIILLSWDCLYLRISKWGFRFFLTWFVKSFKCFFTCIWGQWGLDHSKWSQQTLKITCRILAVDGNGPSTIHCFSGSGLQLPIIFT